MNILQRIKSLNKRISILKEQTSFFPDKKIKVINPDEFIKILKFNIKKNLTYLQSLTNQDKTTLDILAKFQNWLEKQNVNEVVSQYADYLKKDIASEIMRDFYFLDREINFSDFGVICKALLTKAGFRLIGAMTYERDVKKLRFFKLPIVLHFESKGKILDSMESGIKIEDFFEFKYSIMVSFPELEFPITKKSFSLDNITPEVYQYLDKLNVGDGKSFFYMNSLKKLGKDLTEQKFADMIKNREKIDLF